MAVVMVMVLLERLVVLVVVHQAVVVQVMLAQEILGLQMLLAIQVHVDHHHKEMPAAMVQNLQSITMVLVAAADGPQLVKPAATAVATEALVLI